MLRVRILLPLLALTLTAGCTGEDPLQPEPTPSAPAAVVSVEITPDTVQLVVGGARVLDAVARAADGRRLSGKPVVWRSGDESIARVDESGNVTALAEGSVSVFARSGGKQGEARVRVAPAPAPPAVAWVRITGGVAELVPGQFVQLGATLHAADGAQLHGREVAWTSSDTLIARVGADGGVYGLRGGSATITATSDGKSSQVTVSVPAWIVYTVEHAGGAPLPITLAQSADTTERTPTTTVVRERRVKLVQGRLSVSTTDRRYRQLYVLQSWERTISYTAGSAVTDGEALVGEKVVRDEGESEMDPWTGETMYRSATFPGHSFRALWLANGARVVRQAIPGESYEPYTFVFRR